MDKRKFLLFFIITLFVEINICRAQISTDKPWVSIATRDSADLRIDISTIKNSSEGDIYVWGLETFDSLLNIDDIATPIYRVKTYYLINPEQMRYSILEVVYYDSLNTEIKSFNYRTKTADPLIKYNFPILHRSPLEAILNKCREYIKQKK